MENIENKKKLKKLIIYIVVCIVIFGIYLLKKSYNKDSNYFDVDFQGLILLALFFLGEQVLFEKKINEKLKIGLFLTGVALYVSYPLYNDYLVWQHDVNFHLVRIENIAKAIHDFQLPVRIHSIDNYGFGYGTSIFYPELFLYIPGLLRVINISPIYAYKIFLFLINLAATFSMYFSIKKITKEKNVGIIAAVIYAVASYRLENIYTRGAVGEALAMAFLPIVFWGLHEICIGDRKKWYILVIGISGVIQSHILTCVMLVPVCIIMGLYFAQKLIKEKRFIEIIKALIIILLLNIWFIGPFLHSYSKVELSLDKYAKTSFDRQTIIPAELFNIFDTASSFKWSVNNEYGMGSDMNYSLGLLCTLGLIISVIYSVKNRDNYDDKARYVKSLTVISILFIVLATSIFPWTEMIDKYKFVKEFAAKLQFSWRFLGIATCAATISMSIIIGNYIEETKNSKEKNFIKNNKILLGICFVAFVSVPLFLGEFSKQEVWFTKYNYLNYNMTANGEYFLKDTDFSQLVPDNYKISSNSIVITDKNKNGSKVTVSYKSEIDNGYIEVPLLYYPVYSAKDENGKKVEVLCGDNNCIRVNVNKGTGTITISPQDTGIYVLFDIISLATLVGFTVYIIKTKRKTEVKK